MKGIKQYSINNDKGIFQILILILLATKPAERGWPPINDILHNSPPFFVLWSNQILEHDLRDARTTSLTMHILI